jgi:hypothetical protein
LLGRLREYYAGKEKAWENVGGMMTVLCVLVFSVTIADVMLDR